MNMGLLIVSEEIEERDSSDPLYNDRIIMRQIKSNQQSSNFTQWLELTSPDKIDIHNKFLEPTNIKWIKDKFEQKGYKVKKRYCMWNEYFWLCIRNIGLFCFALG